MNISKERLDHLEERSIELTTAQRQIEVLCAAMQEFVDRCDTGSVRSKYTYAKFKGLLASVQPGQKT